MDKRMQYKHKDNHKNKEIQEKITKLIKEAMVS